MVIVNVALMRKENERGTVDADFNQRMEAVEWDDDAELDYEVDDTE